MLRCIDSWLLLHPGRCLQVNCTTGWCKFSNLTFSRSWRTAVPGLQTLIRPVFHIAACVPTLSFCVEIHRIRGLLHEAKTHDVMSEPWGAIQQAKCHILWPTWPPRTGECNIHIDENHTKFTISTHTLSDRTRPEHLAPTTDFPKSHIIRYNVWIR